MPEWLAAGACVETWAADHGGEDWLDCSVRAWIRHRNARAAWFAVTGLDRGDPRVPEVLRAGGVPWSWVVWRDHGLLADALGRRGLPADWEPSPAPRVMLECLPYVSPGPEVVRLLRR